MAFPCKSLKNAEKVLALETASEAIQEIDKIIPKTVEESMVDIKKLTEAGRLWIGEVLLRLEEDL